MPPAVQAALCLLLLPVLAAACGEEAPARGGVQLVPAGVRPEEVVARVNDAPILRADLEQQMKRSGGGRREALQALIRLEVLAQEARRRGQHRAPRVLQAQRRSMANLLIRRDFRSQFSKKDVPKELIEAAYRLNRPRFVHEELVRLDHIVAIANKEHDAAHHDRARRLALKVRGIAASGPLSPKEFREIGALVDPDDKTVTVRAEGPYLSPRAGRLHPSFLTVAFKMHKAGEISQVFQTPFGYHVIYLESRIPPRNDPLEKVEDEIRAKVFEQARTQAFEVWVKKLEQAHKARILGELGAPTAEGTR